MDKDLYIVTMGGLLHDIGKLVQRADGVRIAHPLCGVQFLEDPRINLLHKEKVLEVVRYHHYQDLDHARLDAGHPAYIIYEADNIAAGADRREVEGASSRSFEAQQALQSVFNLVQTGGMSVQGVYRPLTLRDEDGINYPQQSDIKVTSANYTTLKSHLENSLAKVNFDLETPNSVVKILEAVASYIPSSTALNQVADISLFDHLKMTAAIGACMYQYLNEKGECDYKTKCYKKTGNNAFRQEDAFLLVSADTSGIQDFIYTISSKGALKSLRARSFYLELMMEHIADEILESVDLTRANLIYSGGGHFYMLLPNTEQAGQCLERARHDLNKWMLKVYSTSLYIELAALPVSANVLMNAGATGHEENLLGNAFQILSGMLARGKAARYPRDLLERILSPDQKFAELADAGRECVICRTSSTDLVEDERSGGQVICRNCLMLREMGGQLGRKGTGREEMPFVAVTNEPSASGTFLELPSLGQEPAYMSLFNLQQVEQQLKDNPGRFRRLYSINALFTGVAYATNLWVGMYSKPVQEGHVDFSELAGDSQGIKRLAVMRADVDNLGTIFSRGLEQKEESRRYRYNSLSRTAVLSRQLSLFFKKHINLLCREPGKNSWTGEGPPAFRSVVIVYSGGDDVFVAGAWDQVIDLAIELQQSFNRFSCGRLSFSAGIGLFSPDYPISQMAGLTELLESAAKENPGKDSVALFGLDDSVLRADDKSRARHLYSWEDFTKRVIGEKHRFLRDRLNIEGGKEPGKLVVGKTILYHWLNLLQRLQEKGERLNLARMAYHLARIDPGSGEPEATREAYEELRQNLYRWASNDKDRGELLTALYLLIYQNRKKRGEGE